MIFGANLLLLKTAEFSPADLFANGEDGAWYDPSDLSTLWQDTAGTSAVTTAGQSVARIDDKSGNGRHLTQATAADRPTYQSSGGLHWLDFDGADFLQLSTASTNITEGGGTIAAVASSDDLNSVDGLIEEFIDDATDANRNALFFDTRTSPRRLFNYACDATDRFIDLDAEINGDAKTFIFSSDGSTGGAYLDNVQQGSSVTTTANFSANTKITLGRQNAGQLALDGKIYGAIILDRGLTAEQRNNLHFWFSDKAGI